MLGVQAMNKLRTDTPRDALLMGPNVSQMFWYGRRHSVPLPKTVEELPARLADVDWVVITNFQRGQPKYAQELLSRFNDQDVASGRISVFKGNRFMTVLLPGELVRQRW